MVRTECAGCGHAELSVFADLGETPLADKFEATAEAAVGLPRYPLRAAICERCELAQLLDVIDDDLLYGDDYGFRTGGSPSSLDYMAALARVAAASAPGLVAEIGCNDGTLLDVVRGLGRDVLGIDPSSAAEAAGDRGLPVIRRPFTADLAASYGGQAGVVVAANVAAHVTDPHDFLEGVRLLLADNGVAVVEFQYLPDLLAGCMFDLIYHEHRFFYSLFSFGALAGQHGLHVSQVCRTPAQGGSLRVFLSKQDFGADWSEWVGQERKTVLSMAEGFLPRAAYARERIVDTVRWPRRRVYGLAASAKSCTLLNWCGLGRRDLRVIADVTESKLGRFAPGTGIPIGYVPYPEPDAYLLLASNYLSGVLRREHEAGYRGQFIVPLPLPVIV